MTEIEYFYSAHSAFAYIGSRAFMDIAARNNCRIIHRPINLRIVVKEISGEPFGYRSQAHRDYFYDREIERWSEYRNIALIRHRPTWHDEPLELANGFIISALNNGLSVDELVHGILTAHWRDDANFNDPRVLSDIAESLGMDAASILADAMSEEVQSIHQMNTTEAIERDVFGSPTYFVGGDMFYGQDRLEHVERALHKPFSGNWPKNGGE